MYRCQIMTIRMMLSLVWKSEELWFKPLLVQYDKWLLIGIWYKYLEKKLDLLLVHIIITVWILGAWTKNGFEMQVCPSYVNQAWEYSSVFPQYTQSFSAKVQGAFIVTSCLGNRNSCRSQCNVFWLCLELFYLFAFCFFK